MQFTCGFVRILLLIKKDGEIHYDSPQPKGNNILQRIGALVLCDLNDCIVTPHLAPSVNGEMVSSTHRETVSSLTVDLLSESRPSIGSAGTHPRQAPRLRVTFITPCLAIGGVEHWLLGLLKYSQANIEWSVLVTSSTLVEWSMLSLVRQFATVEVGERGGRLIDMADVIIGWGVHDLRHWIGDFQGPIVQVAHGVGPWTESFLDSNRNLASHQAAVSSSAATAFRDGPVTVILNGVDIERCEPKRRRDEVRADWGIAPSEVAVGFIGRLSPEKNPLATSLAVRELGEGYRAVYVGKGYGVDLRPDARALTPNAIFVPPVSQIGDALGALDCVVMASPAEGFSLAMVEGLVARVPMVVTAVGGVPDMQRHFGLSFVTVPIEPTAKQLAEAVKTAIHPQRRPFIEQASIVARTHFSAAVMARRWVEYLQSVFVVPVTKRCSPW